MVKSYLAWLMSHILPLLQVKVYVNLLTLNNSMFILVVCGTDIDVFFKHLVKKSTFWLSGYRATCILFMEGLFIHMQMFEVVKLVKRKLLYNYCVSCIYSASILSVFIT